MINASGSEMSPDENLALPSKDIGHATGDSGPNLIREEPCARCGTLTALR